MVERCYTCGSSIAENEKYFKCRSCHNHFHLKCLHCGEHPNAGRYLVDPNRPSPPLRIHRPGSRPESQPNRLLWKCLAVVIFLLLIWKIWGSISSIPQNSKPLNNNSTTQSIKRPSPLAQCGDKPPGGVKTWYPVFVNRTDESTFQYIQQTYCRDAFLVYRESLDRQSIQVASFLNKSTADQFAKTLLREPKINSGEVGSPIQK